MRRIILLSLTLLSCNSSDFRRADVQRAASAGDDFEQITYETRTQSFRYGAQGTNETHRLQQVQPKLDVLVVVDNSKSMTEEQQNLSTKMAPLLSAISEVDWQIAIATTGDINVQDCFRDLIQKSKGEASEHQARFADAVQAGDQGYGLEYGSRNALYALKGECPNQSPWIRGDSILSIIFVSDEDDCSEGICPDTNWNQQLRAYVSSIRSPGKTARFYGLIYQPGTEASCQTGYNVSNTYQQLILDSGGQSGSICDSDYSQTLTRISSDLADLLTTKVTLSQRPDEGSLQVTVNGKVWEQYQLADKELIFTKIPPPASQIEIQYRHGRSGDLTKEFSLEAPALGESIQVQINGEALAQDQFTFDTGSNKVTLSGSIPDKADMTFDYKVFQELRHRFPIRKTAHPESISVLVDRTAYDGVVDFEPESGMVTLDPPPPESSLIHIDYRYD